MKAILMAGGEGSRLRPLTSARPKPLAPVANKPVMHHIVDLLRRHGITEIIATLHYMADEIETYFGNGSDFGVSMEYVVEDSPLGTAGAVKLAEHLIGPERFVVISGDALTDMDISALVASHAARDAAVTIALQRVPNPLEFGVVVTDESGRITRFLEKPSWGEVFSDTINTGIYVLDPSVFSYMEAGKSYDFSRDLFPQMLRDGRKLFGYVTSDYWTDIGNLQQYQLANYDALRGNVRVEIPGTEVAPGIWQDEHCHIHPNARLFGPLVLGKNVSVEAGATVEELCVLGDSSIVAENAHLHRTIAWEDVYIGEGASLNGCTVADRNLIKERVTVQEGAVIGRGCTIGSGAVINGNIKVWPDKTVSSGAIVSMSLIYGIKWPGSLFGADGITGLANIEITPEFALKLGQAYGSAMKPGQTVFTSRDTHPASRIMNRCIISGLLSVGTNVGDLRSYPLPPSRYAVRNAGDGGIHTRVSPKDPSQFLIEFLDQNGVNIDKTLERKIENVFFREDFRRTSMDSVGTLDFPTRLFEGYTDGFLAALGQRQMSAAGFRVVIDYAFGNTSLILPRLMSNLGVEMIALNAYFDDNQARVFARDRRRHLEQLSNVTLSLQANLGILLDHDGETLSLCDDRGRAVQDSRLFALLTLLVARARPGSRIAVPVTMPRAIEEIAAENGATVIRTRNDRRATMALAEREGKALQFAGGGNYEIIFPEFQPAFDGLYAAAKVMELLAAEHRKLSELVDLLPEWHVANRIVACPWDRKGLIMRRLLDETNGANVELTDGLRVDRDGGWVLVLPDASDPTFNVFAEGRTASDAQGYVDDTATRIEQLARA
ncbi:MAG: NTP transferase domain-containing protein [Candidatus Eremiobacteraeota bacterium]|nr:NTP transferase domain-containing protein [Candidatus Eremiobacteraeota bacterium]MBV9647778.1 NTP transferase domain-containing protein [Candidatus Eremiobacteraeota bacterium]